MSTICMVRDIIFKAKIYEATRRAGMEVSFADSYEQCQGAGKLIVDLEEFGLEGAAEFRKRNTRTRMIGYLPHVMTQLRSEALRSGFDSVLPRSEFSSRLLEIL